MKRAADAEPRLRDYRIKRFSPEVNSILQDLPIKTSEQLQEAVDVQEEEFDEQLLCATIKVESIKPQHEAQVTSSDDVKEKVTATALCFEELKRKESNRATSSAIFSERSGDQLNLQGSDASKETHETTAIQSQLDRMEQNIAVLRDQASEIHLLLKEHFSAKKSIDATPDLGFAPATSVKELNEILQRSDLVPCLMATRESNLSKTVTAMLEVLLSRNLANDFSMTGLGADGKETKMKFDDSPACAAIESSLAQIPKYRNKSKGFVKAVIRNALEGVGDVTSQKPLNPRWSGNISFNEEEMPASLRAALYKKGPLVRHMRVKLLDFIYESITKHTFFLQRSQKIVVVSSLLRTYPHLAFGMNHLMAMEYWGCKIGEKLRNRRKRRDRDIPCVVHSREQRAAVLARLTEEKKSRKSTHAYGLPNYYPTKPASKDNEAVERHRMILCNESEKTTWNVQTVDASMQVTYHDRRCKIVEGASLQALKEEYPCLFDFRQLCVEFERIAKVNIYVSLQNTILSHAQAVLQLTKSPDSEAPTSDDVDKDLVIARAILALPKLMNECSFTSVPPEESGPMIVIDDVVDLRAVEGNVKADGVTLCRTTTLLEAFTAWFAAFAVFDLSYPSRWRNTLIFTQKFLLNFEDNVRTPEVVLDAIKMINELKQ